MQKHIFLISLLSLPFLLFAQDMGNYNYGNVNRDQGNYNPALNSHSKAPITKAHIQNNQFITFEVNALMNKAADSYMAIFNLTQLGETAEEANNLLYERYNGFVADVQKLGIQKEQVFLDMISLVPLYEVEVEKKFIGKDFLEVPKGFELQMNVHIKYDDAFLFEKIASAAAKNRIYDFVKTDYFVEHPEAMYDSLRERCIKEIKKREKSFAQLGIDFDSTKRNIGFNSSMRFPPDCYASYQAFCSSSLNVKKGADIKEIRKPTTFFYNKVPYDQYDIVVNAAYNEPVVQFSYSLVIRYTQLPPKPKKKVASDKTQKEKQILFLTPEGELKTVDVQKWEE